MAVVDKYSLPYDKITMKVKKKGRYVVENLNLLNSQVENDDVKRKDIESLFQMIEK